MQNFHGVLLLNKHDEGDLQICSIVNSRKSNELIHSYSP